MRVTAKLATSPIATPTAARRSPSPRIAFATWTARAPSAMRTPISRTRCATENAITA